MFKKRNEGFTLVELLIVLAVIAALLAIVTPVAVRAVSRAKATQVASTLRNIAAAAQQYYYTEKALPDSTKTLYDAKYIQGNVDDYGLSVNSGSEVSTITIVYNGKGVELNDLQSIWDEIIDVSGKPGVKIEVSQYW